MTVLHVWIRGLFNGKIGSRLQIAFLFILSKFPSPPPPLIWFYLMFQSLRFLGPPTTPKSNLMYKVVEGERGALSMYWSLCDIIFLVQLAKLETHCNFFYRRLTYLNFQDFIAENVEPIRLLDTVILCKIWLKHFKWDSLRNLVPFIQFKKHVKRRWRIVTFSAVSLQLY